ncbi:MULTISPECIES: sulfurtransferase TusA family protein [Brevibacillus]|uniref:Rhodanese domain-containing protein n=1 Tax=Brevibacillus invocatus TaxID=173959 RepID=A0A3M8BWH0_9BACL|nr:MULTISPECIES: sulfurtransferase TusA family protein [Brevibacillus]MDH4619865.1 sulfurtransferase TusA family protein [Brevibacillus sp. AY1]RNB67791.1 hypothetical protein EDM52_21750 [Brevibacillus invocatus]
MNFSVDKVLDCKGLACPMPIVKTKKAIEEIAPGQVLEMQATDKGSVADIQGWAKNTGHEYLGTVQEGDLYKHYLRKANPQASQENAAFAQTITNAELLKKMEAQEKVVIVDVREADEFASGHIPGAIAIPYGELTGRLAELNQDEELYIVCRTGNRSDMACKLLAEKGFSKLINVLPGMSGWSGPVQSGE